MRLVRERAAGQLLHRPYGTGVPAAAVVRHLLAVQAQDLRAARTAVRARGGGDLPHDGSLVVAWLMRGTLHLICREDHGWLLALTAPARAAANARRLRQEGVSDTAAERGVEAVAAALARAGPLPRPELASALARAGVPTAGQAVPHLLMLAALRGRIVALPNGDFVGIEAPPAPDRAEGLSELGRRYSAAHARAEPEDLARWAGLPLRDARAAWVAGDPPDVPRRIPPRLLAAFDPYMLGWRDRGFALPAEHARAVHPGGGVIRPVATVDGRVVGTWTRAGGLDLFGPVPRTAVRSLEGELAEL